MIDTEIDRFSVHCYSGEPIGVEAYHDMASPRGFSAVVQNDMNGAAFTLAVRQNHSP